MAILIGYLDRSLPNLGLLFSLQLEVPLGNKEIEDIVIYLSSLGKHNTITMDNLTITYNQWFLAQQKSMLTTTKGCTYPPLSPCLPVPHLGASMVEWQPWLIS